MLHAEVIIPLGVKDSFTYLVPEALAPTVGIGKLVVVPFGKKEWYTGVVCALWEADGKNDKIKMITHVVDGEFALSPAYLRFLRWVSEYYMASLGMVVRAALPVSLRLESGGYLRFLEKEYDESENALSDGEMEFMRRLERALGRDMCHDGKLFRLDEIYAVMARQGMSDFSMIYSLVKKGVVEIQETEYRTYRPKWEKFVAWGRTFSERELHEVLDSLKRAKAQYALLCNWIDYCGRHDALLGRKAFAAQISPSASALKALCDRGVLRILDMEASRLEDVGGAGEDVHSLTPLQREVMEKIRALFQEKDCVLLQGVTSSGKTEVYIHLIRKALEQGKQVLYLLPEIGLTVQLVRRLRRVFGRRVGIYHSGLSDGARAEMWRKQNGSAPYPIVLGVRSSIFLPFRALGLVIVDEEHDPSYKQQEPAPRYNGRDAAVMLGRLCGAKILLGSATPSLESFRNAESGKYGFVRLLQRFGGVLMPEMTFVDIKEYRRKKLMKGHFSPVLLDEMGRTLGEGGQVILFHNRRGYSTYVQCDTCGAILKCVHCDGIMNDHMADGQVRCHYCGRSRPVPSVCETCGKGSYLFTSPPGTERIEEEVRQLFPACRVARVDTDVMGNKAKFRQVRGDFEAGKIDVLVGTQMVAKGLDFAGVRLVGVMDAAALMGFFDFRAEERAYDTLVQVSGRCGRREDRGKVVIQVSNPGERVYDWVAREDFRAFYAALAEERALFHYPPYYRLIQVELRHRDVCCLRGAGNRLARAYREKLGNRVCGPAEPQIGKVNGVFRLQLFVKIEQGGGLSKLKIFLEETFEKLCRAGEMKGIRMYFDVDPL